MITKKNKFITKFKVTAGFTLVELLLVVGIVGIIAGIGGDMFATVMRAYRKAELFSLVESTGNSILTQIEQDLRSASYAKLTGNVLDITMADGSNKSFTFTKCSASNAGSILSGANSLISPTASSFYNTSLFVSQVPIGSSSTESNFVEVIYDKTGTVPIAVFISFKLIAGSTGACDTASKRVSESYFQTTVNLRGGIQ